MPASGWWIMTRAFGSAVRLPFAPAASSRLAIDAACPTQKVATGQRSACMVS